MQIQALPWVAGLMVPAWSEGRGYRWTAGGTGPRRWQEAGLTQELNLQVPSAFSINLLTSLTKYKSKIKLLII